MGNLLDIIFLTLKKDNMVTKNVVGKLY